jgi:hypothetical protein
METNEEIKVRLQTSTLEQCVQRMNEIENDADLQERMLEWFYLDCPLCNESYELYILEELISEKKNENQS